MTGRRQSNPTHKKLRKKIKKLIEHGDRKPRKAKYDVKNETMKKTWL